MPQTLMKARHVEVTSSGPLVFKPSKGGVDLLVARAIGFIKLQAEQGVDQDGKPFVDYAPSYKRALAATGRLSGKKMLMLSGGMMKSLGERSRTITGSTIEAVIGPGLGRSPKVPLPGGHWSDDTIQDWLDSPASKAGGRLADVSQNVIGYWHQTGAGRLPVRRWCGLSPKNRERLKRDIVANARLFFAAGR